MIRIASIAAGLTFMLASVGAQAAAMTPAQRLDHLFSQTRTLSAHFSETVQNANAATVKQSSGTLAISKPGRFRWNYEKPYKQLIVADGEKLWLYDPGLEQVTVRPETRALAAGPAALLAGTSKVEDQFKVTDAGTHDGLHWVSLAPLNAESDYTAMRVGLDSSGQLKELQLDSKLGQTTRIVFSDLKRNTKLDADLFKFTPPKGADVVHQQSPAAATGG
ncbi:MAG: outer membrane lipoprotein chaperone LolA [Gammaproteobacteria bacterium]